MNDLPLLKYSNWKVRLTCRDTPLLSYTLPSPRRSRYGVCCVCSMAWLVPASAACHWGSVLYPASLPVWYCLSFGSDTDSKPRVYIKHMLQFYMCLFSGTGFLRCNIFIKCHLSLHVLSVIFLVHVRPRYVIFDGHARVSDLDWKTCKNKHYLRPLFPNFTVSQTTLMWNIYLE